MAGDLANSNPAPIHFRDKQEPFVRSFQPSDRSEVLRLYREGILAGELDPADQAADLYDIDKFYFQRPQDHFWVAEANGIVIGTVAVSEDVTRVAHLRRLRVAPNWQRDSSISVQLIRAAISHARSHGCLKLIFHTTLDSENVVRLLNRLGFQFARIREIGGRHLIEFYDNLYATGNFKFQSGDHDEYRLQSAD